MPPLTHEAHPLAEDASVPALVQHFEDIAPPQLEGLLGSRSAADVNASSGASMVQVERVAISRNEPAAQAQSVGDHGRPWAGIPQAPSIARAASRDSARKLDPGAAAAGTAGSAGGPEGILKPGSASDTRGRTEWESFPGVVESRAVSRLLSGGSEWQANTTATDLSGAAAIIFPPRASPPAAAVPIGAAARHGAEAGVVTASQRAGFSASLEPHDAAFMRHARSDDAQPEAVREDACLARSPSMGVNRSARQRGERVVRFSSGVEMDSGGVSHTPVDEVLPMHDSTNAFSDDSREPDRVQAERAQRLLSTLGQAAEPQVMTQSAHNGWKPALWV